MPLLFLSALLAAQSADQSTQDQVTYSIALPEHAGQLHWDAPGFKITQNSAKANGHENKLNDAEKHLQQAFTRKVNLLPGETMPDPTKDDSFLPYKENKEFWQSIERLNR